MSITPPADSPYYQVNVADNFRYMDKEAEYVAGHFAAGEKAIAECKLIVERCLGSGLIARTRR